MCPAKVGILFVVAAALDAAWSASPDTHRRHAPDLHTLNVPCQSCYMYSKMAAGNSTIENASSTEHARNAIRVQLPSTHKFKC